MAENIENALPVHLAVVDPAWSSGHNVVVDGHNADNYFHLNFGWGGYSNGWYLLPDEFPYGLTVLEGVVVDIVPNNVGISKIEKQAFHLFPNPAHEIIYLDRPETTKIKIEILNSCGQLCYSTECTEQHFSMDISGFKNGMYIVRMENARGSFIQKIIKY